ncbi:MAG: hypothetical protein N3I35_04535 [Clostridia bacterium]|nr:hypothetical protein [Clostridia bacterium]
MKEENINIQAGANYDSELLGRIECAYRIYKLSEMFLRDVENDYTKDYGKLKIARLRYEFAQHEMLSLLKEARAKGIRWRDNEFIRKCFYPDTCAGGINNLP